MLMGRFKGITLLFFIAYSAKAGTHPTGQTSSSPAIPTADSINIERLERGSKALADRIAGMLLCTYQNAPGGKDSSTLEWYFASSLSNWNNEVLERMSTAKEINFNKDAFGKNLQEALLNRSRKKELPEALLSAANTITESIATYSNNILVQKTKLSHDSTKSMSRFEKDQDKKIRAELAKAHKFAKENSPDCEGTNRKSAFWATYNFIPDDRELSSAEKIVEDEADHRLMQASTIKPTETPPVVPPHTQDIATKPTGNDTLEKDLEDSLENKNEDYKGDGKRGPEKQVRATVYYIPDESNYPESKNCSILNKSGNTLAKVNCDFKKELAIQGSGILRNGKTVNYSSKGRYMYTEHRYGLGSSQKPLVPFRSLAMDVNYWNNQGIKVKDGDKIYIKSTDGMKIPGTNEIHNGVWEVSDRGGKIKGNRIDLFFGTMSWRKALKYVANPENFSKNPKDMAQIQNLGSKSETLDMNFITADPASI